MAKEKKVEQITDMEVDFAQWFTDVCTKAELVDYSDVKGLFIMRPYGYAIWENIQKILDGKFKATGHQNVAMPMLIPESLLQKEKDHVEGFAPECAWVTMGGSEELPERLCVRPTSETLFCQHWSHIVHSWRDLPCLYNQWCSVMRWEKTTRPFLRGREFLWQEGHTLHATEAEARKETLQMLEIYAETCEQELAMPVIRGLIMTHGDNSGLVLPPHIAPIQVIVLPIAAHKPGVTEKAEELVARLKAAGLRAQGDFSDNSPGWKFANWEMKGVPLRVEIGPKDIEAGHCVAVRRDNGEKITVALDELEARIPELLETVQQGLFDKAKRNLDEHTYAAHSLAEAKELQEKNGGFIKTMWCGDLACELEMKDKAGMSSVLSRARNAKINRPLRSQRAVLFIRFRYKRSCAASAPGASRCCGHRSRDR